MEGGGKLAIPESPTAIRYLARSTRLLHPPTAVPAGLPQLYFYMLAQRKKVLSGGSGSKAAAGGSKKRQ